MLCRSKGNPKFADTGLVPACSCFCPARCQAPPHMRAGSHREKQHLDLAERCFSPEQLLSLLLASLDKGRNLKKKAVSKTQRIQAVSPGGHSETPEQQTV